MKFGEKIREERNKLGLTQQAFAKQLGVSLRTITNYETGSMYPKKRETYSKLAELLDVDMNYLLTEDEEFTIQAHEKYGARGAKQAIALINEIGGMFAGGELSEEDMDGVMRAMQELYWDTKKINKKYTPKKYSNKE